MHLKCHSSGFRLRTHPEFSSLLLQFCVGSCHVHCSRGNLLLPPLLSLLMPTTQPRPPLWLQCLVTSCPLPPRASALPHFSRQACAPWPVLTWRGGLECWPPPDKLGPPVTGGDTPSNGPAEFYNLNTTRAPAVLIIGRFLIFSL